MGGKTDFILGGKEKLREKSEKGGVFDVGIFFETLIEPDSTGF